MRTAGEGEPVSRIGTAAGWLAADLEEKCVSLADDHFGSIFGWMGHFWEESFLALSTMRVPVFRIIYHAILPLSLSFWCAL